MSQPKTQLQQVTEHLLTGLTPYVTANSIDAWQENGTLLLNGEDKGAGSYQIAKWKHSAIIAIEKFPHLKVDPYNLLAMLAAFLLASDWPRDTYGLADPQIDLDIISNDNATVIIELELMDDIELIPDEEGPVLYLDNRYRVALAEVFVAEEAELVTGAGGDE
ncbi:phage tail protein [Alkalimonas mucilaginosa]|uniref:Phage tail protein n=1 Tax=Alkalimonas mucilaginosa TaxID=3057676 RepID=A0ABU7JDZ4_9GAMM|nr:phage tail protein [Alkalimonas sp. MEB004]MEE2023583.1 phage tail protein [Alkalimonas sp. MEB004]